MTHIHAKKYFRLSNSSDFTLRLNFPLKLAPSDSFEYLRYESVAIIIVYSFSVGIDFRRRLMSVHATEMTETARVGEELTAVF